MTITIDSTSYDVAIKIVNRRAEALDKYAERTQDGELHRELIGWFFNYDIECGMSSNNVSDYAALFLKLTEPTEFHTISMPGAPSGYGSFTCYFASIRDELQRYQRNGVDYFRNLSFSVIAKSPARVPV